MAQVAPELMTFTVQVPDNAPPGALVQFTAPNGQSVQAQIPPGLGPGAQFTIAVPAAVQQQHGPDTAVGVVEEGGLQGVLRGLDGVVYFPRKDMLAGQDFTVHATDQVVDVFALDRAMFDAANAAKRRVHLCNGAPGTLDIDPSVCVAIGGPCTPPWTAHFIVFCPLVFVPQICNLIYKHKDMDFPPWADHALIVTDRGVVGRRGMRPDRDRGSERSHYVRDVNAIAWDGFDVDKIEVRRYAEDKDCYWNCDKPPGQPDPLSYAFGFGLLAPWCWKVVRNPTTPGLYRAKIASDHTTTVTRGDHTHQISTARIEVIALARTPEDLLESLRAAKAKYHAPAAQAMERPDAPPARSGPKVRVRGGKVQVGCSVM